MSHALVIAEVGVNHNGQLDLAIELTNAAKESGADIVKFQFFDSEDLTLASAQTADYQYNSTSITLQKDLLRELELSKDEIIQLKFHCNEIGIEFLSTAFDCKSLEFLMKLGMERIKIPSGEITNIPLLMNAAKYNVPILLSTGMSTLDEISMALDMLKKYGSFELPITIMHCTSNYPAQDNELNLRAMQTIANEFNCPIGYSDHSIGNIASIGAIVMGATVIEKHITLDKSMVGPDHSASMEIDEFVDFIKTIRRIEMSMGSTIKQPTLSELQTREHIRKSIVALVDIKAGEIFSANNITTKRPGTGLSAEHWLDIIGSTASRNYKTNEMIDDSEA